MTCGVNTGCTDRKVKDMTGLKFYRLLVVSHAGKKNATSRSHYWNVVCDCGNSLTVNGSNLRSGDTKSCGCLQREIARAAGDRTRTHSMSKTSIYSIWDSMIQRCHNQNRKDFPHYGGRGIEVCARWRESFDDFLSDMGNRPEGMSIDRIDWDKGYEPSNCRWASSREQARNRPDNRRMTLDGVTKCMVEWAELLCINPITLQARLRRGWSEERSLTEIVDRRFSRA